MDFSRIVVVDFETDAIEPRPVYPPQPVGVAIRAHGTPARYLRWGHPTGNNCSKEQAADVLRRLWEDESLSFVFHNAAFDVSVAVERMGVPEIPWHRVHDTMFLLFLYDPHAKSLGLKPAAEALLEWPKEEQDELYAWIWDHRKALLAEYPDYNAHTKLKTRLAKSEIGAWIAKAPGDLVARYAIGDVGRTYALFRFLYREIGRLGMMEAYDRERRLQPILMENERRGLRVDLAGLEHAVPVYQAALEKVEHQMRAYLGASGLSFDNDRDVADVFQSRGVVHEDMWTTTAKSRQLSVSKENLTPECFTDPLFASAFGYRNRLVTCLKMFMVPWLEQAAANNGYIHTSWNQVRGSRGGTRSGRPSMSKPNLLNVSKDWHDRSDGYEHPAALDLPELPMVRGYVLADEDEEFLHRDFSGQEVRIFAHFENGELADAYRANPRLDPHSWLKAEIQKATGKTLERTRVKNVTFARLYGGGVGAIETQARCASRREAQEIASYHDQALPGRRIVNDEIQRLIRRGEPIRTWGGRLYHVERPAFVNGRRQTFEYKLINYLVQGSAADVTKEAICRWYYGGGTATGARFLLTVYDEINLTAPRRTAQASMEYLRECMEGIELDVPLLTDGKRGQRWGALEKCE